MFASATLARRIEAAEAALTFEIASSVRAAHPERGILVERIGGGVGAFAGGSPYDKIIGLGFAPMEPGDEERLGAFERAVHARGGTVQVEVSTLADPSVARDLTARGYRLIGFENVLGLPLDGPGARGGSDPDRHRLGDITVVPVDGADLEAWSDVVADGFAQPDVFDGPAAHESFSREAIAEVMKDTAGAAGMRHLFALRDGVRAGGASMRTHQGIAQLTGAATLPAHRRRGVQTALLRARLAIAAQAGCDVAVITTQPGSVSMQSVMRLGFALLYARAVLSLVPR